MDTASMLALTLLGVAIAVALALTVFIVWFLIYTFVYAKRIFLYSLEAENQQIPLYIVWLLTAIADVFASLIMSVQMFGEILSEKVINRLPLILGLILLSFAAIAWTEYHDVYLERGMDIWQCFVVPLFYDLRAMTFVNLARLVYNIAWPFVRFIARLTRFFLRTLPFIVLECASLEVLGGVADIGNGVFNIAFALANWTSGPGGITNNTLDVTESALDITRGAERILLSTAICTCEAVDFLPRISFGWLSHNSTAALINSTVALFSDALIKIPIRTITGTNKGTVPGTTADYGYVPNLDILFDDTCEINLAAGRTANRFIYILVSELVGIFDPSIFTPGSPEEVILLSNWIGFVARSLCALTEAVRWIYHVVWSIALVIINVLTNAFGGTPPVPLLCDLREWRALYDFGGRHGLYYKNGGISGQLRLAIDELEILVSDITDPIAAKLSTPFLRIVNNFVFGTLNLVMRAITHGIDSEFRMFSPVLPPRTGIPATTWTPPVAHPPAPLSCAATTFTPGNFWVWLQHYFDDPEGAHLLVVDENFGEVAEGLDELGSLALPALGDFLRQLISLPVYAFDYIVQTIMASNIVFTETPVNFALFVSRWRFQRYLDAYSELGNGLGDSIRELHPVACVDPSDGIFCALGEVFDKTFALFDEVGIQFMLVFTTAREQNIQLPNFALSIQALEDALAGFGAAVTVTIPPFPLQSGVTLREAFADLFVTFPRAVIILLSVPNYAIASFQGPLDEMKAGSPFPTIAMSLGDWFKNLTTFAFTDAEERLCDTSPNALIPALGLFLDRITSTSLFSPIASAICVLVDALKAFVTDFALELLGLLLNVFGRFIDIFFNPDSGSFGTRIGNFFDALGNLVAFILLKLPTFLLELFFGFIAALLPEPLNIIFTSVAQAIINGLCSVLQFFISTVIDVLNFFGASLTPVDLSCGVKRSLAEDHGRDALVRVMIGAYESNNALRTRVDRIKKFLAKKTPQRRVALQEIEDASNGIPFSAFNDSVVMANRTAYEMSSNGPRTQMSIDEAIEAVAEFAEWRGDSLCDKIVLEISRRGIRAHSLSLLEQAHLESCVSSRALGEIVSVLPYMHWFPRDGFYNAMSWAQLSMEAIRAYRIFSQYNQDRSMPREVVLSDTYRESWQGLRVDHLTIGNYAHMIHNMTLRDYFERNNGNYEIIRGVLGLWNATRDSGLRFGTYLDSIANVVDTNVSATSLENWLYGYDYAGGDIPEDIAQRQHLWRSILRVVQKGAKVATTAVNVGLEQQLHIKVMNAAMAAPDIVVEGVRWMASEPTQEWRDALRQRDEVLARQGIYLSNVTDRTSDSGIFGYSAVATVKTRLGDWMHSKMQRGIAKLRPNSPRARRNWQVIGQFFHDAKNALRYGFLPDSNGQRPYTPKYATGLTDFDAQGEPVAILATCNTSLVPFCLNCQVLDGALQETVIGGMEFVDYWDNTYPGYAAQFDQTQAYIEDENINVCGGTGSSEIHFPSDLKLIGNTTFFDVLGGNGGALNGLIAFFESEIGSVINSLTRERVYGTLRRLLNWPQTTPSSRRLRAKTTDTFIVDYLNSHTGFDPLYDGVASFADITVIAQSLDDFHSFLGNIEFRIDVEPNPFGNGTVEVPTFDTGSSGFLGNLFSSFIAADYSYDCDQRFMSLKQGILLFALAGVVLFFVLKALSDLVLPPTFSTIVVTFFLMVVLPFLFFVVVYGMPLQNLFFLPLPTPPPCFANDAVDLVVCDVLPKCPALVAGLVDGPYNEANCRSCPFGLDFGNCKRDYDMTGPLDTILFLLEWWVPDFMDDLRNGGGGIIGSATSLVGIDLTRYENLDLSIKDVFDALVSCSFVMFIATIPVLFLAFIALSITGNIFVEIVLTNLANIATVFLVGFLILESIGNLLTYNLIFVITPAEIEKFQREVRKARNRRASNRGLLDPRSIPTLNEIFSGSVRYVHSSLGLARIASEAQNRNPFVRIGSDGNAFKKRRHRKKKRKHKKKA